MAQLVLKNILAGSGNVLAGGDNTGNVTKVTIGANLTLSGGVLSASGGGTGSVTSVALTRSGNALTITGSPITTAGTINIGFAGTTAQYIRGDGTLATFPTITGYVPYTGATQNLDLGTYGLLADFVGFNTAPTSIPTTQGTLSWNVDKESLDLIMNGTTGSLMQDSFYNVKNQTGVTIPKGTVVRANGTVGASGRILIAPFLADGTYSSKYCMGVTAEAIADGADGKVLAFGALRKIDTSAYTNGTILYASPTTAGAFTTTEPSNPNNIVTLAIVVYSDNTNGEIFVRPTFVPSQAELILSLGYTPANDANVVKLTGNQTVGGVKTFSAESIFSNGITLTGGDLVLKSGTYTNTINTDTLIANRSILFPDNSGTVALTSDIVYPVTSVFGRTGDVVAVSGDYNTDQVTEGTTNLYYTNARARGAMSANVGSALTYDSATGRYTLLAADSGTSGYLTAADWTDFDSKQASLGTGTTSQFLRGDLVWATPPTPALEDLTDVGITSPTNGQLLRYQVGTWVNWTPNYVSATYFSATAPLSYNSGTGVFSISQATTSTNGYLSSTDWNTFNNKQDALTNPVTGTGATGYIAKWNTASTITNSLIYEASSKVGINTTNMVSLFDVTKNALGVTVVDTSGITLKNETEAITGNQQISPALHFKSNGWNNLASASQSADWIEYSLPIQGNAVTSNLIWASSINGASYTTRFTLSSAGNGTFTGSVTASSIIKSGGTSSQFLKADGSIDSNSYVTGGPYLPLSGGTLTGPLGLNNSQFYEQATPAYALDARNSDLIGINGIYFNDYAEAPSEGLNWYNTASVVDSLWSAGGVLYYTPNRTLQTAGTSYTVYHTGNLPSFLTGSGSNTRIAYWTGSNTLSGEDDFAYDYSNNRLRINSTTWSSSAATKLLVGGLLSDGSDAIAQINGFVRMKNQLIIHLDSDITKSAAISTIDNGKLFIDNTLLINTSTNISGYNLIVNGQSWLNNFGIGMRNTYTTSTDYPQLFLTDGAAGGLRPSEYGHVFIQSRSSASRGIGFITGSTPTERLWIKGTGEIGIGTTDPNNSMLQIVGDWVSGYSTLRIQGLSANQTGIGLFNTSGARKSVWAYTGSYTYLETDANDLQLSPNGIARAEFQSSGTIQLGGGTTGVTQRDVTIVPTSGSPAIYFGRLSSTNDDNTKVYFQNRVGTTTMFVDSGNQKVGIGTLNPTALYGYGLEIFDNTGGGTLTLSRDAGNQRGVIRMGRNNGGSYQGAIQIIGDSTAGTGAGGNLFMQTTDSAGTFAYRISMLSSGRVVVGNSTTANGILQVTGEHVSGYGMLNMNSTNSCIIAMDSSAATPDTYLRMKHAGTDRWYVGMNGAVSTYNYNIAYQGNGNPNLTASSSGDVFMPYRLQIASTGGFSSSSAKLLVGSIISGGSSAIMQVNGFIRMRDQLIIHQDSNTANETYIQCTGANALATGGSITASSFFESSDKRLKKEISDNPIIDNIIDIKPKLYIKDGKEELGYYAQDLEIVLPSSVSEGKDGFLTLSYSQVHTAKIAQLEAELAELKEIIKNLIK